MKKLGFGFMRLPLTDSADQTSIDLPLTEKMADLFLERGFTYFDTAWMYHDFASEQALGRAVVARHPRESFTVASKMPVAMLSSLNQGMAIFEKQKHNLGVEYFDNYLVHDMGAANYETAKRLRLLPYLRGKREAGEIRRLGFSCHDRAEHLDQVLTECPFFEFVQLQINYLDWDSEGVQSRKCYEVCEKHHKPVIVMEPVKGGTLARLPEKAEALLRAAHPDWSMASWALRFAAGLPNVETVLSGMSDLAQLEENTAVLADPAPLTAEELSLLREAAGHIRGSIAIPCTGCRYCVEENECPQNIPIPGYFSLFNTRKLKTDGDWAPENGYYDNFLDQGFGRASDCVGCQGCERVCPQHIEISQWMPRVAKLFEG